MAALAIFGGVALSVLALVGFITICVFVSTGIDNL